MPVTVRNTSSQLMHVPLASGSNLRLAPGQASDELPDAEVTNNARIDELQRRGAIEVTRTAENPSPPVARGTAAPAAEDTSTDRASAKKRGG
jgi:hypothetical protein